MNGLVVKDQGAGYNEPLKLSKSYLKL